MELNKMGKVESYTWDESTRYEDGEILLHLN